jgi:hypothetical protein
MNEELIAPCGMNCGICSGYLAFKHETKTKSIRMPYCAGCRPREKKCAFLKKRCDRLLNKQVTFCYECPDYPCENLNHIDKRYKTLYSMSMIENLEFIKKHGIGRFLEKEAAKWQCPECGEVICCHNGLCFNCGLDKLRQKKQKYRWDE